MSLLYTRAVGWVRAAGMLDQLTAASARLHHCGLWSPVTARCATSRSDDTA